MKSNFCTVLLALALLAPVSYAGDEAGPPSANPAPSEARPKDNCSLPCMAMKVSTRCECPLRKTLPTSLVA